MMPYTKPALRFTLWCVLAFLVGSVQARGPQDNYGEFEPSSFSPRHEVVLVGWDTEEGQTRLARAAYKADFFQLASNFQPQANPLYCGIASSVIVLNAMRLHKNAVPSQAAIEVEVPEGLGGGRLTYPAYSQLTLLGERTESVKPRAMIELRNAGEGGAKIDPGLTLAQLKGVLEAYDTRVALHYAHQEPEEGAVSFREVLKLALADSIQFVIVNFKGRTLGAPTDGHISPVAAYDEASDSVLLLDVAGYLNPWYWVPVNHLYGAMHTLDGDHYRGYLVVEDRLADD